MCVVKKQYVKDPDSSSCVEPKKSGLRALIGCVMKDMKIFDKQAVNVMYSCQLLPALLI